jgi:hypothetical protein
MNDAHSKPVEGTAEPLTFRVVEEVEISWLPVSESAFLLWVLALLVIIWLGIGVALGVV